MLLLVVVVLMLGSEKDVHTLVSLLTCDLFGCALVGEALDLVAVNNWLIGLLPAGRYARKLFSFACLIVL